MWLSQGSFAYYSVLLSILQSLMWLTHDTVQPLCACVVVWMQQCKYVWRVVCECICDPWFWNCWWDGADKIHRDVIDVLRSDHSIGHHWQTEGPVRNEDRSASNSVTQTPLWSLSHQQQGKEKGKGTWQSAHPELDLIVLSSYPTAVLLSLI